jgi:hypothetical protein
VYFDAGYILNATIQNAQIADLAVDDNKIASLDVGKLTAGTISADRIASNSITADKIDSRNLTIRDSSNNIIFSSSGTSYLNVSGLGTLATQNTVSGTTQVTGLGGFAFLSTITAANIGTYIQSAAIGTAYIANAAITNAKIGNAAITSAKIGDAEVGTLKIQGNAVTIPLAATSTTSGANATIALAAGDRVFVSAFTGGSRDEAPVFGRTNRIQVFSDEAYGLGGGRFLTTIEQNHVAIYDGGPVRYYPIACPLMDVYTAPVDGNYRFVVVYTNGTGQTGIQVVGLKR